MERPLADAAVGDHYVWHASDGPQTRELIVLEFHGEPWVTWDYLPIAPAATFPATFPESYWDGTYEKVSLD